MTDHTSGIGPIKLANYLIKLCLWQGSFLRICFVLLKAQDDYISQLHVKFNEIQQYAVSTEEVRKLIIFRYLNTGISLQYYFPYEVQV